MISVATDACGENVTPPRVSRFCVFGIPDLTRRIEICMNCTTVSIDAFHQGFPEYNLHQMSYSTARDLEFYLRGAAQGSGGFISDERVWPRIWWPLDLMALLDEQYVPSGLVQARPL